MKRRSTIFTAMILLLCSPLLSQKRYFDEVFTEVTVQKDVKYAENYSWNGNNPPFLTDLLMDVYQPKNDTIAQRPIVILAHGGSFLEKCTSNTLPFGDRKDSSLVEMCHLLARKGYVAISMDYRLGWNPYSPDVDVRRATSMYAIYRGMQDMRACIRFIKLKYVQFGIDTNRIVIGGSEAGAIIALACNALQDSSELRSPMFYHTVLGKPYIDQKIWGDPYGKNGDSCCSIYNNPGPTSNAHLILSLGGAVPDTSWIETGEKPILAFHGINDAVIPFKSRLSPLPFHQFYFMLGSYYTIQTSMRRGNQNLYDLGFNDKYTIEASKKKEALNGLFPFEGTMNGFEAYAWYDTMSVCIDTMCTGEGSPYNPCASKPKALLYIDTILGYSAPRMVQVLELPGNTVGVEKGTEDSEIKVYPNPFNDWIKVEGLKSNSFVYQIKDNMGRSIINGYSSKSKIDVSNLNRGVYHLYLQQNEGEWRHHVLIK